MSTAIVKDHYQDQSVAESYDQERFHGFVGRLFDNMEKHAILRPVRRVQRACPNPSVLDVPCGTGRITELLLGAGLKVTGGDISREMMDVAARKCQSFGDHVEFRRLDLDGMDVPDGSFDLVTCVRLFHHLDTAARAKVLVELARVSRRFVIANVALSTTFYRARRKLKRWLGQGISRESSTWDQIHAEVAGAGLTVVGRNYVRRWASEDLVLLMEKV